MTERREGETPLDYLIRAGKLSPLTGGGPCGRCGVNPSRGMARIGDEWFCHEDQSQGATCYMLTSWERSGVSRSDWLDLLGTLVDEAKRVLEKIAELERQIDEDEK